MPGLVIKGNIKRFLNKLLISPPKVLCKLLLLSKLEELYHNLQQWKQRNQVEYMNNFMRMFTGKCAFLSVLRPAEKTLLALLARHCSDDAHAVGGLVNETSTPVFWMHFVG